VRFSQFAHIRKQSANDRKLPTLVCASNLGAQKPHSQEWLCFMPMPVVRYNYDVASRDMADSPPTTVDVPSTTAPAPGPAGQGRAAGMFRALKHRNFQLFFGGQIISLVGTWMQTVAEAWLIYRLTGSGALLGVLGFVGQIPIFLLSPLAGLVADRWPRRRVVIATQASSMLLAFTLAALTLSGQIRKENVWEIIALATLLGTVNAFDVPARQSFLIEMVGRENLLNAIALNSSMFNGARVAGPAIAAGLVAVVGEGWCFLLNGVSYLAVIAGLFMMLATESIFYLKVPSENRTMVSTHFSRRSRASRVNFTNISASQSQPWFLWTILFPLFMVLPPCFWYRLHCGFCRWIKQFSQAGSRLD